MFEINQLRVGVIGLGYVGLPLAVEFGRQYLTCGFDINHRRVDELRQGIDHTLELSSEDLRSATGLTLHDQVQHLAGCNFYIITVPTPIDAHKQPDLNPLRSASELVGDLLAPGDIVVYESTVYPGATEEVCIPILEARSTLKLNRDFFVGYSPERINPGDKIHRLTDICKLTSGSNLEAAAFIDQVYASIIKAGTHLAPSIRVAEAAKVIENTQRDVNIALMNELAQIFERMGIDTKDVLEAAGSKWNFLKFSPGLVGGHCIGVDPYYLNHKAQELGYQPTIIPASRIINDGMGEYVARRLIKLMAQHHIEILGAEILILGLSFKENCPDLRNTRVVDIINELESYSTRITVYDPWIDTALALDELALVVNDQLPVKRFDVIVLAVAHRQFLELDYDVLKKENTIIFDVKSVLAKSLVSARL